MRSVRLVSFTQRAVAAILWEVEAVDEPARDRRAVRARGQRAAAGAGLAGPAGGGCAGAPLSASSAPPTTMRVDAGPPHQRAQRPPGGRRDGPRRRWAGGHRRPSPRSSTTSAGSRSPPTSSRRAPAAREVPRLRLVGDALAAGGARPGRGGAGRGARTPAGTGCSPASASTSTTSGRRPTWSSRATTRSSRRCASGSSTSLQAGARAERRAIPAKGSPGPATTGTPSGTPRRSCCRCSPTRARRGRRGLRWRHSTLPLARERAAHARPARRHLPVADDRGRGVLGLLAGGDGGVPRIGRHRRRGDPLPRRSPATRTFEREIGLELLVETARLWLSLGHHDHGGGFRIDGVTGPGRVQRDRGQQRLHEPDGAAEPARRRRRRSGATPSAPRELGRGRRRGRGLAAGRGRDRVIPYDEELGVHAAVRRLHPARGVGLRGDRRTATRCCCTSPTSSSTASRWSSSPTSCSRCTCAATPSPPSRRRATSTTTSSARCATRRCRPAPRR